METRLEVSGLRRGWGQKKSVTIKGQTGSCSDGTALHQCQYPGCDTVLHFSKITFREN